MSSSFKLYKNIENDLTIKNIQKNLKLVDKNEFENIIKYILLKKEINKTILLYLLFNNKIPKNLSFELFFCIVINKFYDIIYKIDYVVL